MDFITFSSETLHITSILLAAVFKLPPCSSQWTETWLESITCISSLLQPLLKAPTFKPSFSIAKMYYWAFLWACGTIWMMVLSMSYGNLICNCTVITLWKPISKKKIESVTDGTLHQTFKARIGSAKPAPLAPSYGHWLHIPKVRHILPEGLYSCFKPSCKFEYIHPIPSQAGLKLTIPVLCFISLTMSPLWEKRQSCYFDQFCLFLF